MRDDFILYWSSFTQYEKCPQQFLWSRGWGQLDVGGGPGKKKPKPIKRSEHFAFAGTVIGAAMEKFYNERLWETSENLKKDLVDLVRLEFQFQQSNFYLNWDSFDVEDLRRVCTQGILNFISTMENNDLKAPYAQSEVEFIAKLESDILIGGRADLVLGSSSADFSLYDGKNSLKLGTSDPDQLKWYALLVYLLYGVIPRKLGFIYYRYPFGTLLPSGELFSGIQQVACSLDDLKVLGYRAKKVIQGLRSGAFTANPKPKHCKNCIYESVCPEKQEQKAVNSSKRKRKKVAEKPLHSSFKDSKVVHDEGDHLKIFKL